MLSVFSAVLHREWLLAWRTHADVLAALAFFVIVAALVPLGVGAEAEQLRRLAPGMVWIAALLASALAAGRLFAGDHADGSLEQLLLSAAPLSVIVVAKVLAHWLVTGLPMLAIAPLLALQFGLPADEQGVLWLGLLLGTPVISLINAIGSALTLGLRGGGVLLSLLVLPLQVPILILGTGAVQAHAGGLGADAHLKLIGGLLAIALALAPPTVALALRIAVD